MHKIRSKENMIHILRKIYEMKIAGPPITFKPWRTNDSLIWEYHTGLQILFSKMIIIIVALTNRRNAISALINTLLNMQSH